MNHILSKFLRVLFNDSVTTQIYIYCHTLSLLDALPIFHRRGPLMGLADLVVLAGIEKDALGGRRLTGVDVRHDADVAIFLERMAAGHDLISVAGAPSTPQIGRASCRDRVCQYV